MPILAFLLALFLATPAWADTFGPGYREIQEEGTAVTPRRQKVNFIGAAATAADDAANNRTNITFTGGGAPTSATYITQTADGTLSAEQALESLATGIMRVATTTGVITSLTDSSGIAANISDEQGSGSLVFATSPTLTTPTIGAATATSIAIGANTLTTSEWANLDGQNQAVQTTSNVSHADLTLTGTLALSRTGVDSIQFHQEVGVPLRIINFTDSQDLIRILASNSIETVTKLITTGGAVLNGTVDASGSVELIAPYRSIGSLGMSSNGAFGFENGYKRLVARLGGATYAIPVYQTITKTIMFPDLVQAENDAPLLAEFPRHAYPHGFKLLYVACSSDGTNVTFTYNLEEWTGPADAAPSTLVSIPFVSQKQRSFDSFSDSDIAPDGQIRIDLDTTDHSEFGITLVGYAKTS